MEDWFRSVSHMEKVYPEIDPFHSVFQFADNVYSLYEENIDSGSAMWLHLIDGPEKALLVDTGTGIGDLKALVRHLIGDKELYVVNTHEHWDHVMGNPQFERVWCHTLAVPSITENCMRPDMWERFLYEEGEGRKMDFRAEDLIPYRSYALCPCEDCHVFDLGGGHLIEAIGTPGHAPGGLSFLDHRNRILFTGGMHSDCTVIAGNDRYCREMNTVEAFLEGLEKLQERHGGAFDRIFAGHEIVPLDSSYIVDQMQACRDVIADRGCYESTQQFMGQTLYRHEYASAGLRFTATAFR